MLDALTRGKGTGRRGGKQGRKGAELGGVIPAVSPVFRAADGESVIFQGLTPESVADYGSAITGKWHNSAGGGLRRVRVCSIIPFARCDTAFVVLEVMVAIRLAANPACVGFGGLDFLGGAGAGAVLTFALQSGKMQDYVADERQSSDSAKRHFRSTSAKI